MSTHVYRLFGNPAATVITHFTEEFLTSTNKLSHYHAHLFDYLKCQKVSRYQHRTVVKVFPTERAWASASPLVSLQRSAQGNLVWCHHTNGGCHSWTSSKF